MVCKHTRKINQSYYTNILATQCKKRKKQGKKQQQKKWDICEYIAQLMANRVQQSPRISK